MDSESGFIPEEVAKITEEPVKKKSLGEIARNLKSKANFRGLFRRKVAENPSQRETDQFAPMQIVPLSNEQLSSIDPSLNSKATSEIDEPEVIQETRSEIEIQLEDFLRKISTAKTPQELFTIQRDMGSQAAKDPTGFRFLRIIDPILKSTKWTPDMNFSQDFDDPELERCKQAYDLLVQKAKEVGIEDEWIKRSVDQDIERLNQEKARIAEMFQPGKFIAHGGYTRDLSKVIVANGLASSWSAVNNDLIRQDDIKRFPAGTNADSNALFLFPFEHDAGGVYVETSIYLGKRPADNPEMMSDLAYIYPAEYLVEHSGTVGIKGQEVFVTGSEDSIKNGGLTSARDDKQILPLDGAFIVVPEPKYQEAVSQLLAGGKSQEWVSHHVTQIPFIANRVSSFPNGWDSMVQAKGSVEEWLQAQHHSEYKSVKVGIKPQVFNSGTNYILIEAAYD